MSAAEATVTPIRPVIAEDDGVREVHGCIVGNGRLVIDEDGKHIRLAFFVSDKFLTPKQARYFARKLYRLARRIESREVEQ